MGIRVSKMCKIIYADNAATTPVSREVLNEILPYFTDNFGNASTVYSAGRGNRAAVSKARKQVADAIGAKEDEIYFTAGGSESDNRAVEGVGILLKLDAMGICASSGSACTSASLDPSHVLLAIGLPHEVAHGSLRITFSTANTAEEAEFIGDKIVEVVTRLRKMSPVWED